MPPLPADSIHARACKLKCEKILTRPLFMNNTQKVLKNQHICEQATPNLGITQSSGLDHHAVFSRQRVDVFKNDDVASTQSARQHKDATDLVVDLDEAQDDSILENETLVLLIRRLTPLECERLQGFPDGWTDIEGASDSARYKALGNSVAIPCVDYVLRGIAWAITAQTA